MPKININGIVRDMTEKEVQKLERMQAEMPASAPDPETRMDEIEAAMIELAALITGGEA